MGEEMAARLAVARLDELSSAPPHRYREEQPMGGFCLISGDGERSRVTLYIENGRALTDRTGAGSFYYEGWLVGPEGPVSLGAFNLGPGGQGSATRVIEAAAIRTARSELVRVTAEPFGGSTTGSIAVLEGRLVWLETGAAGALNGAEALPPGDWVTSDDDTPVAAPVLESVVAMTRDAEGEAEAEAEAGNETPVEPPPADLAPAARPEAAAPVEPDPREPRHANPLEFSVQLVQRHPMAPRASGTATLNLRQGHLTLMLRGLPSPTALGRDRSTDRPFNAYRVWLVNQQTGTRAPAGYCQRAWGENFRLDADGLALARHDTILVTVEDRSATGVNSASPQVLIGSYGS